MGEQVAEGEIECVIIKFISGERATCLGIGTSLSKGLMGFVSNRQMLTSLGFLTEGVRSIRGQAGLR